MDQYEFYPLNDPLTVARVAKKKFSGVWSPVGGDLFGKIWWGPLQLSNPTVSSRDPGF